MTLSGEIAYLYAFDIGQEVLVSAAPARFTRRTPSADRLGRLSANSEAALLSRPLEIAPAPEPVTVDGAEVSFRVRVYAAGAVAVTARVPFATSVHHLRTRHSPRTASGEPLAAVARRVCEQVRAALGDAIRGPTDTQGPEGYSVFVLSQLVHESDADGWLDAHRIEVAGLLTGLDGATLSESRVAEASRHRCALERTDAVVVDWDAALVIDAAGRVDDVLYVLEVANLQLQEWKVLDAVLDRHLDRAHDHFARSPGVFSLGWGATLRDLRRLRADAARLTDEVSNIGKFFDDWYLARVYQSAKDRFHLDAWRASVDHRLSQLGRIYGAMQADANDRRMLWLEVLIVLLIAVELLLSLIVRH